MERERREDRMIDKLLRFWPVAAVIVAGASGYIKLQIDVSNVKKVPEQVSALEKRMTVLETKMEVSDRWRRRETRSREE